MIQRSQDRDQYANGDKDVARFNGFHGVESVDKKGGKRYLRKMIVAVNFANYNVPA